MGAVKSTRQSQLLALPRRDGLGAMTGAKDSSAGWLLQHQRSDAAKQAGFLSRRREPKLSSAGLDAFLLGISNRRS
jgi:hypothetical protein